MADQKDVETDTSRAEVSGGSTVHIDDATGRLQGADMSDVRVVLTEEDVG